MNDLIFKLFLYCIVGNVYTILRMLGRGEQMHRKHIERETGYVAYSFGTTVILLITCILTIVLWPWDLISLLCGFVKERRNKKRGSD